MRNGSKEIHQWKKGDQTHPQTGACEKQRFHDGGKRMSDPRPLRILRVGLWWIEFSKSQKPQEKSGDGDQARQAALGRPPVQGGAELDQQVRGPCAHLKQGRNTQLVKGQ